LKLNAPARTPGPLLARADEVIVTLLGTSPGWPRVARAQTARG
jgi:hypothetical protein